MADLLTRLQGRKIHDASSIHLITPNASSYTVQMGDSSSNCKSVTELALPTDINQMLINLTPNLILKDTSVDVDISLYNRTEVDEIVDTISVRQTFIENLSGDVAEYDPYVTYYLDAYAKYDENFYRCVVTSTTGAWDASCWLKTSLYDEIADIRGVATTTERVEVHVGVNYGTGSVAGATLSLIYDGGSGKAT